jgi:hypothetical protein
VSPVEQGEEIEQDEDSDAWERAKQDTGRGAPATDRSEEDPDTTRRWESRKKRGPVSHA